MEIHVFVTPLGKVEHISLTNEMKKWCLGIWALSRSDPWEARWQFSPTLHSDLIQWKLQVEVPLGTKPTDTCRRFQIYGSVCSVARQPHVQECFCRIGALLFLIIHSSPVFREMGASGWKRILGHQLDGSEMCYMWYEAY